MTLQNLLYKITEIGIKQKVIQYAAAGADIYAALNDTTIKDYPILFVSPTGNHTVGENTTVYSITLYYLDRLLSDNSNDVNVMSSTSTTPLIAFIQLTIFLSCSMAVDITLTSLLLSLKRRSK